MTELVEDKMKPVMNSTAIRLICPYCEEPIYTKYKGSSFLQKNHASDRDKRKCPRHSYAYMFWFAGEETI